MGFLSHPEPSLNHLIISVNGVLLYSYLAETLLKKALITANETSVDNRHSNSFCFFERFIFFLLVMSSSKQIIGKEARIVSNSSARNRFERAYGRHIPMPGLSGTRG